MVNLIKLLINDKCFYKNVLFSYYTFYNMPIICYHQKVKIYKCEKKNWFNSSKIFTAIKI